MISREVASFTQFKQKWDTGDRQETGFKRYTEYKINFTRMGIDCSLNALKDFKWDSVYTLKIIQRNRTTRYRNIGIGIGIKRARSMGTGS